MTVSHDFAYCAAKGQWKDCCNTCKRNIQLYEDYTPPLWWVGLTEVMTRAKTCELYVELRKGEK